MKLDAWSIYKIVYTLSTGFREAEVIRAQSLSRFAWRFSVESLVRRRVSQGRGGLDGAGLAKWDASMATFGSTDVSS
jgi:hypothetical protein